MLEQYRSGRGSLFVSVEVLAKTLSRSSDVRYSQRDDNKQEAAIGASIIYRSVSRGGLSKFWLQHSEAIALRSMFQKRSCG